MTLCIDISPDSTRQALLGLGMPAWQPDGLVEDYDIYRRGEAAKVTSSVREVTGIVPVAFSQFARDYKDLFPGKTAAAK